MATEIEIDTDRLMERVIDELNPAKQREKWMTEHVGAFMIGRLCNCGVGTIKAAGGNPAAFCLLQYAHADYGGGAARRAKL